MNLPNVIEELIAEYNGAFRLRDGQFNLTFNIPTKEHRESEYVVTRTLQCKVLPGLWTCSMTPPTPLFSYLRNALIFHLYNFDFAILNRNGMMISLPAKNWMNNLIINKICLSPNITIDLAQWGGSVRCSLENIYIDTEKRFLVLPISIHNEKASLFINNVYQYIIAQAAKIMDEFNIDISPDDEDNSVYRVESSFSGFFPSLVPFFDEDCEIFLTITKENKIIIDGSKEGKLVEKEENIKNASIAMQTIYPYLLQLKALGEEDIDAIPWLFPLQRRIFLDERIADNTEYKIISREEYCIAK